MSTPENPPSINRRALMLLHDIAAELEMAFRSYAEGDYCIEIPAKDARRMRARYECLRKKMQQAARNRAGEEGR